jgi:transposase
MPWKECSVMEERPRFVARLLEGETMSEVCREFGISRKTGYKLFDRYREHGLEALSDWSRRLARSSSLISSFANRRAKHHASNSVASSWSR